MAATIDEDFNESYAQSGLQPSVGVRAPIRSVSVEYKQPSAIERPTNRALAGDARGAVPNQSPTPRQPQQSRLSQQSAPAKSPSAQPRRASGVPLKQKSLKKLNPATLIKERVIATRITVPYIATGISIWLSLQLPLAVVSIVMLASAYMIEEGFPELIQNVVGDNIIATGIKIALTSLSALALKILDVIGVDLVQMGYDVILGLFVATNLLVFLCGLVTLLIGGLMFTFTGVKCLYGKGATPKIVAFIAALVGYTLPLFNIFPWFIFWALVVWRYPK